MVKCPQIKKWTKNGESKMLKDLYLLLCASLFFTLLINCKGEQRPLPSPELETPTEASVETPASAKISDKAPDETTLEENEDVAETPSSSNVLSFKKDILPIVKDQCMLCHPQIQAPDWTDYEAAKTFATNGKLMDRVVIKKDMPLGTPMSDELRNIIKEWILSGANM